MVESLVAPDLLRGDLQVDIVDVNTDIPFVVRALWIRPVTHSKNVFDAFIVFPIQTSGVISSSINAAAYDSDSFQEGREAETPSMTNQPANRKDLTRKFMSFFDWYDFYFLLIKR